MHRRLSTRPTVRMSLPLIAAESPCSYGNAAGWTYCGIGALSLLGKLPPKRSNRLMPTIDDTDISSSFYENVVHFLVCLQTSRSQEEELDISPGNPSSDGPSGKAPSSHASSTSTSRFQVQGASVDYLQGPAPSPSERPLSAFSSLAVTAAETERAGFSGRCNKIADTCYSFWVGGTLAVRTLS